MAKAQKIEKTEEFISSWQKEICLWGVRSKKYYDRNEKDKTRVLKYSIRCSC